MPLLGSVVSPVADPSLFHLVGTAGDGGDQDDSDVFGHGFFERKHTLRCVAQADQPCADESSCRCTYLSPPLAADPLLLMRSGQRQCISACSPATATGTVAWWVPGAPAGADQLREDSATASVLGNKASTWLHACADKCAADWRQGPQGPWGRQVRHASAWSGARWGVQGQGHPTCSRHSRQARGGGGPHCGAD